MRNHLDGHVQFTVQLGQHVYGGALTGQIEVGQRLVKHQQLWVAHQRLGDGHTLAQTAGQFGQTVPRLVGDAGELQRLECFGFLGLGDGVDAESGAGQAQQHGLFGGEIGIDIRHIALRHISDAFVHLACGLAQHGQAAMAERQKAQLGLIIVVLPVPLVPTMAVTEPVGMAKVPCCQMIWSPRLMAASLNTMQSEVSLITPDCGKRC